MKQQIITKRVQYGSLSYRILNYARFKTRLDDGCFSADDYQSFLSNPIKPSVLSKSIKTLLKNGHLETASKDRYRFVDNDVLKELDLRYKDTLHNKAVKNRSRNAKAELDELHSDDF